VIFGAALREKAKEPIGEGRTLSRQALKRRKTRLGELSTLILLYGLNCVRILCNLSMFCVCIMVLLNSRIFPETA